MAALHAAPFDGVQAERRVPVDGADGQAWHWPASTVFDRRRLVQVVQSLLVAMPHNDVRGWFRTRREWYDLHRERDTGAIVLEPTAWRQDNRLWLPPVTESVAGNAASPTGGRTPLDSSAVGPAMQAAVDPGRPRLFPGA